MERLRYNFNQIDLLIEYCIDNQDSFRTSKSNHSNYIFILVKGTAIVEKSNKIAYLNDGDAFYANKNEQFSISITSNEYEYIKIQFNEKIFHELDKKIDIIKAFSSSEKAKLKTIKYDSKNDFYKNAVKSIIRSLLTHGGRGMVMNGVLQMICEINYIYNDTYNNSLVETDSNFAKLYKYLDDHIYDKITIKSVSEATFISERNITYLLKKYSNATFHQFITQKRLDKAKALINKTEYPIVRIANNCGFSNYGTFIRLFKNEYNMTPNEYRLKNKERN